MTVHRPRRVVQVYPVQHLAEALFLCTFEPVPFAGQRRVGLAVIARIGFKQVVLAPEDRQALRLVAAFGQMAKGVWYASPISFQALATDWRRRAFKT